MNKNKLIRVLMFSFLFLLCTNPIAKGLPEVEREITKTKNDQAIYWGEGIVNIKEDFGNAKIEAKERALSDLTQTIKVKIETEITSMLLVDGQKIKSDDFTEKIKLYTNQIVTNVKEKYYIDYPEQRLLTYIVSISKAEFDLRVAKDLAAKKLSVRQAIISADNNVATGKHITALNGWIAAYEAKNSYFGDIPVIDDIDGDGQKEEVAQTIIDRINEFIGSLVIAFVIDEPIKYYSTGRLNKVPIVQVHFKKQGIKTAVSNAPLKVIFVSGSGNSQNKLSTGEYGQCSIPIEINAINSKSVITVAIDQEAISGFSDIKHAQLPFATLSLDKIQSVALSVNCGGRISSEISKEIHVEIESFLSDHKLSSFKQDILKPQPDKGDISVAASKNADFLLHIFISNGIAKSVGDYKNMYVSKGSGNIILYSVKDGSIVATQNVPGVKGYGVDKNSSTLDAYYKIKKRLGGSVAKVLKKIW